MLMCIPHLGGEYAADYYGVGIFTVSLGANDTGGIIGAAYDEVSIYSCINYGLIVTLNKDNYGEGSSEPGSIYIGGIAGHIDSTVRVKDCLNAGDISGAKGCAGCVIGYERTRIEEGGYIANCWFVPASDDNYCNTAYGRSDNKGRVDIQATTIGNAKSSEWLSKNIYPYQ